MTGVRSSGTLLVFRFFPDEDVAGGELFALDGRETASDQR